jgi:hypothetical protein
MASEREPVQQPHFLGRKIGIRYADRIEAQLATPVADARAERCVIVFACQR